MIFRQALVRLLDTLWREPRMILKYYMGNESKCHDIVEPFYVFMVDGKVGHGGMFDRLKGIVSIFAVAKSLSKGFRIHFSYPFVLEKYLEPHQYDWRLQEGDLVFQYPKSRPIIAYGECYNPIRIMKDCHRQVHFYYGYDSLNIINEHFGTNYEWGELYHELFQPTAYLQQFIDRYKQEIGTDFIAIHTRFLNLLGDKTETAINPELPVEKRQSYMQHIVEVIQRVVKNNDKRIMIASDSMTFIKFVEEQIPNVYVVPGTVKHIDTAGKTDYSENIKMFLDYYLIGNAKKVYNIVGPGMWPSAFPEYAAKIGRTEFERIVLDDKFRINEKTD